MPIDPGAAADSSGGGGQSFAGFTQGLGDIFGRNTDINSTGTMFGTTEQEISKEGMDYLLRSILGSTQGLAAVAQGEKSSGLYNSSTGSLLISDLIARSAGEVATRNVKTKTNQNTTQNQSKEEAGLLSVLGEKGKGLLSSLGHSLGF